MNLEINPETERLVEEELRSGHFRSADDLIVSGIRAWREKNRLPNPAGTPTRALSGEEKARAFEKWANGFPDTPPLSDEAISRESMYPDRW